MQQLKLNLTWNHGWSLTSCAPPAPSLCDGSLYIRAANSSWHGRERYLGIGGGDCRIRLGREKPAVSLLTRNSLNLRTRHQTLIYLSGSCPLQRVQMAIHRSEVQRGGHPGSTSLQPGHVPSHLLAQSLEPCTRLYHNRSVSPEGGGARVTTGCLRPSTHRATCSGSISLLSPKSVSTTWPSASSRMFSSLMSRYTMPSWRATVEQQMKEI